MSEVNYFAYGPDMHLQVMLYKCPEATFVDTACLKDFRFLVTGHGIAAVKEPMAEVHGVLWRLTPTDVRRLDEFEPDYVKNEASVEVRGESVPAVFFSADDMSIQKPRPDYMIRILRAAEKYSFPLPYVEELRAWL